MTPRERLPTLHRAFGGRVEYPRLVCSDTLDGGSLLELRLRLAELDTADLETGKHADISVCARRQASDQGWVDYYGCLATIYLDDPILRLLATKALSGRAIEMKVRMALAGKVAVRDLHVGERVAVSSSELTISSSPLPVYEDEGETFA